MDLEKSLLTLMVGDIKVVKKSWDEGIRPEHFEAPLNRQILKFIQGYWLDTKMEKSATLEVVQYEFNSFKPVDGEIEEDAGWIVTKLKERHTKNGIQKSVGEVAVLAGNGDISGALKLMTSDSWGLSKSLSPRKGRADLSTNVVERQSRYAEKATFVGDVKGVPSGFDEVDAHTFGLLPGELCVEVGYAKTGKTWKLVSWFVAAKRAGFTPYLATLELTVAEMEDRIDAFISGLDHEKIQRGKLSIPEVKILMESQEEFAALGPSHIEKPPKHERTVLYLTNRARELNADIQIIDQLSFMKGKKDFNSKTDTVEDIMFDLKEEISEDENAMMATVVAAQFNRASMKVVRGRGGMQHIGLSASIEQTVDIAFGLNQTREMRANRSMVMDVLGFRRGAPESWLLKWDLVGRTDFGVRSVWED